MKSGLKTITKNKRDKTVTKFTKTKIRHKQNQDEIGQVTTDSSKILRFTKSNLRTSILGKFRKKQLNLETFDVQN